jgi:hypothetical protein
VSASSIAIPRSSQASITYNSQQPVQLPAGILVDVSWMNPCICSTHSYTFLLAPHIAASSIQGFTHIGISPRTSCILPPTERTDCFFPTYASWGPFVTQLGVTVSRWNVGVPIDRHDFKGLRKKHFRSLYNRAKQLRNSELCHKHLPNMT